MSSPLSGNGSVQPNPVDVGVVARLSGSATGGTPPYSFAWTFGDSGFALTQVASHSYSRAGPEHPRFWVNDSAGATWSQQFTVDVAPDPSASVKIVPAVTDVGLAIVVSAFGANGTTPYAYTYTGLPAGCPGANLSSLLCRPAVVGTFPISVNLTDSSGRSAFGLGSLTVHSDPSVTAVVASPATVDVGHSLVVSVGFAGGTGTVELRYSGLPGGCSSANTTVLPCTPTEPGTFHVVATVSDGVGGVNSSTVTVHVLAPGSPNGPSGPGGSEGILGLPGWDGYVVVGVAALVGGAMAGRVLGQRRRRAKLRGGAPATDGGDLSPGSD